MTDREEHRSGDATPGGSMPKTCIRNGLKRGQVDTGYMGWTITVVIMVIFTMTVIFPLLGINPPKEESELEQADNEVMGPYDNQPWYETGAMPLLLVSVGVIPAFGAGLYIGSKRGDPDAN